MWWWWHRWGLEASRAALSGLLKGNYQLQRAPTTRCPDYRTTIYYSQSVHCNGGMAMIMTKRTMMTIIICFDQFIQRILTRLLQWHQLHCHIAWDCPRGIISKYWVGTFIRQCHFSEVCKNIRGCWALEFRQNVYYSFTFTWKFLFLPL